MKDKDWLTLTKTVAEKLNGARDLLEQYQTELEDFSARLASSFRNGVNDTSISQLQKNIDSNSAKETMQKLKDRVLTANLNLIEALISAIDAINTSIDTKKKLNLIIDNNNFRNISSFIQTTDKQLLTLFVQFCMDASVIRALTLIQEKSQRTFPDTSLRGLEELTYVLNSFEEDSEDSNEEEKQ